MSSILNNYLKNFKKNVIKNKHKYGLAFFLLFLSFLLSFISGFYAEKMGFAQPQDLFLDYLPVIDLSFLVVWLQIFVIFFLFGYYILKKSEKLHFFLSILSLFVIIRSLFSALTHLKAPQGALEVSWSPFYYDWFHFSNNLFFSSHVGLPFLAYLLIQNKGLKNLMLIISIVQALSALFMHIHYSIDVVSAYFITYGIYKIGLFIFKEDGRQE